MPSAIPLPRGPSVLVLGSAWSLLASPGCPACRYLADSRERFLSWFALEGHADPVAISRLCASRGMCPRHTRTLMSQPGAATRLTALYGYVLRAVGQELVRRPGRAAPCPACAHDDAAVRRAVEMLLGALADGIVAERYRETGGLCLPHLRVAVVRGSRRAASWLAQAAADRAGDGAPSLDWLAGGPDHDAGARAALRAALRLAPQVPQDVCLACLAAARAEHTALERAAGISHQRQPADGQAHRDPVRCLCAIHVRDAVLAGRSRAPALLAVQAAYQAERLSRPDGGWRRAWGHAALWAADARHQKQCSKDCPVCRARSEASHDFLQRRTGSAGQRGADRMCIRDVFRLRALDAPAGQLAARLAAERACVLIDELAEAFRKGTWATRNEARGREMTAWQRAAAFLDGEVFGGCPPGG